MSKNKLHNYGNSFDYGDTMPFFPREDFMPDKLNNGSDEYAPLPQTQETQMETLIRRVVREEIHAVMSEALKAYFGNG